MRHITVSRGLSAMVLAVLIGAAANTAAAQSVWQKIQKAAQPPGQAQQQPQQSGRKPATPGQQAQSSASQISDTGPFTPPAGTKIDPVVMSPIEQGAQFSVSPKGIHVATVAHSGSRLVVIYDGAEGPKFDQVFPQDGVHPVVFSPDGNRYAYCAQAGNEWVVMLDGKEVARSSESNQGQIGAISCTLYFTSNSKHFYYTSWVSIDTSHTAARFVFDGKASPLGFSADMRDYVFSPDGDHYAYLWNKPVARNQSTQVLIVDGQPSSFPGGGPQWSADSKHLFTSRIVPAPPDRGSSATEVFLDGKPYLKAQNVSLTIPSVGNMVVAKVHQTLGTSPLSQSEFLVIGGSKVPGSEMTWGATTVSARIESVVISPDGKHYAAVYGNTNGRQWVFSDGKRGLDYVRIDSLMNAKGPIGMVAFSGDSSKVAYVGFNGTKQFLVLGNQEIELPGGLTFLVAPPVGSHIATDGRAPTIDGQVVNVGNPQTTLASALDFSPDGTHYAFLMRDRSNFTLYLDGVPQTNYSPSLQGPITNISTRPFVFSPDSKHLAYFCHSSNPAAGDDQGLCVDGKYVRVGTPNYYANLVFTSDSNHLLWTRNMGLSVFRVFADGKAVSEGFLPAVGGLAKETWQTTTDGSVLVLLQDETSLKRVAITPSSSTSIATLTGGTSTIAGGK